MESLYKIPKDVPSFCRQLREERGWTMLDMGNVLGSTKHYVFRVENDQYNTYLGFLRSVWEHLELSRREILNWESLVMKEVKKRGGPKPNKEE